MNSKLIKLLGAIAISLCFIITIEWLYAHFMRQRLLTLISSETHQDYKADELPDLELSKQPEESYVDLVARPLFIKGRKPVDEPSPEVAQVTAKPDTFDWQLSGVFRVQKTVSALFSRTNAKVPKDNYRKISLGKTIDGWKLAEINTDKVVLKLGSSEKTLLLKKPKSKVILPQRGNGPIPNLPSPFNIPAPPAVPGAPASAQVPAAPAPNPGQAPFAFPEPAEDDTVDDTIDDSTEVTPEINE